MKIDPETSLNTAQQKKKEDASSKPEKKKKNRNKKQKKAQKEEETRENIPVNMISENTTDNAEIPMGGISHRLAVVDLDWENIGASEIYRLVNVFVPKENIKKVVVYKTKLGKVELDREEKEGPPVILAHKKSENNDAMVREYIKRKMKYFYGVVELETEEAARELYTQIDGLEIEETHNYIDVRFIPNELEIDDEMVEEITEPSKYIKKIPINSLYSTNPKIHWDEDPARERYLKDLFDKDFDLKIADNLIDASDDEEKQAYYKSMLLPENTTGTPSEKKPKGTHKEHAPAETSVDNEDIKIEENYSEEESSETILLGEDERFAKKMHNPDFTVDVTHPAYIAKQKKMNKNKE